MSFVHRDEVLFASRDPASFSLAEASRKRNRRTSRSRLRNGVSRRTTAPAEVAAGAVVCLTRNSRPQDMMTCELRPVLLDSFDSSTDSRESTITPR